MKLFRMKSTLSLTLVLIAIVSSLKGQDDSLRIVDIEEQSKIHINRLSSPKLLGRSSLTGHDLLASYYIDSLFREFNLSPFRTQPNPSNFQPFTIISTSPQSRTLTILRQEYQYGRDFLALGSNPPTGKGFEVVFGGIGDYDGIDTLDIKGKALLIITNNLRVAGMKIQEQAQSKGCSLLIVVNPANPKQFTSISQQLADLHSRSHYRISSFKPTSTSRFFSRFGEPLPQVLISDNVARVLLGEKPQELLQKMEKGRVTKNIPSEIKVSFNFEYHSDSINTHNVIGYLPSHKKTQHNIVICAHFDHLAPEGNVWYPGADDNASGIAVLLEVARKLAQEAKDGYQPQRNIVFAAFNSEEIGLLGSHHYSLNPLFTNDSTVVVLNFDMLGRMGKQELKGNNLFLGGANRIKEFDRVVSLLNQDSTLKIDSDHLAGISLFSMSDHYHFENKGIPSYLLTTGLHADYHKSTDTAEKIMYNNFPAIVNLVYDIIRHFADKPNPWEVDD